MAAPIVGFKANWGIKIRGVTGWQNFLRELEKRTGINSDLATRMGETAIDKVKDQVSRGQDMNGTRFQKYSTTYGKRKKISAPDLRASGRMISSIRYTKYFQGGKTIIIVTPTGTKEKVKAWVHHVGATSGRRVARFRMPKRAWFGLQQKNVQFLKEMKINEVVSFLRSKGRNKYLFS